MEQDGVVRHGHIFELGRFGFSPNEVDVSVLFSKSIQMTAARLAAARVMGVQPFTATHSNGVVRLTNHELTNRDRSTHD